MSVACHVLDALSVLKVSISAVAVACAGTAWWTGLGTQLMYGGPAPDVLYTIMVLLLFDPGGRHAGCISYLCVTALQK